MTAVVGAVALGLAVLAVLVLVSRSAGFSRATRERLEREVERVAAERDAARRATTLPSAPARNRQGSNGSM